MDPNRVTFDPTGFGRGALSGIEIIDQLSRAKAFAQAQAELAATREGRLGATNATNLATIQLAPQKNIADILLAQQQSALIPGQTEDALAKQQFNLGLRPFLQNVERQKAETADALAVTRADHEIKQAKLDDEKQDREAEIAPIKGQFDLAKLTQDFENLDKDKSMSDTQKLATIRNTLASAAQSEASADYTERNRPKANVKDEQMKEISQLQLEIQRLQATPVLNPNLNNNGMPVPYLQYQGATRDPNGKVLKVDAPGWFSGDQNALLNPEAERISQQLKILQDRRDALTKALVAPTAPPAITLPSLATPNQSAPSPTAQPKSSSGAKAITTQAEFNALKPGDPFIWNGKQGVKTK